MALVMLLAMQSGQPAPATAQATATAPTPPARPNCSGAEYRQLDFWVGEWNVINVADGVQHGTSRIERVMDGCGISEAFDAPQAPGGPYRGVSYSSFDRNSRQWHQMYVDVNGSVGRYTGALEGEAMAFTAPGPNGAIRRMVYRPQADGSVRQTGSVSTDGGRTWRSGYDYVYRRR